MQDMLSPVLTSAGHRVTSAETAEQANKLMQQAEYGVIVLDAKSRNSLDETALLRQPNALRLVLNDGQKPSRESVSAGDIVVNQFDRRSLLDTIAAHLETLSAAEPMAANLNDAPLEKAPTLAKSTMTPITPNANIRNESRTAVFAKASGRRRAFYRLRQ